MAPHLDLETAHAVIHVVDPDAMVDFYTTILGFEVTDRGLLGPADGPEIIFLSQTARHHHQLAFITGRAEPGRSNNLNHVAFRSGGSLDDLRSLHAALEEHPAVRGIRPLTHGNAWSVYFADPEGNGVEVFIDTPWHVPQPQGEALDLSKSNDEIVATTEATFAANYELSPIEDFYARRADELAERSATSP